MCHSKLLASLVMASKLEHKRVTEGSANLVSQAPLHAVHVQRMNITLQPNSNKYEHGEAAGQHVV